MNPHDQFAKNYLEELLKPLGTVETSKEVSDETRQIDVYFSPNPGVNTDYLGLLGKIVSRTALIEAYRNPPTPSEVRNCLLKLYAVCAEKVRAARRENRGYGEDELPYLWILTTSASDTLIEGLGAGLDLENYPEGVYFLPRLLRTAIISINRLPVNRDTLWLRLLGRGQTQLTAVRELLALPEDDVIRQNVMELLVSWRVSVEISNLLEPEERELFMSLSQTYLQWKEATKQEGREEGLQQGLQQGREEAQRILIQTLLQNRFGRLDSGFEAVIESLLKLPPEEYSPLLLSASREDLLRRFAAQE